MSKVFVVGMGMTPFGKLLDSTVKSLTQAAVQQALDDAGATARHLEAAFYANTTQGALEGQLMIGGQVALRSMEFKHSHNEYRKCVRQRRERLPYGACLYQSRIGGCGPGDRGRQDVRP